MNDPFKFFHSILEIHISSKSIQQLQILWNEKTRFCHSISHLNQIFYDIEHNIWFNELSLVEKHTLVLGAFFHDAIFDSKKTDNEDRSIDFFKRSYIRKDSIMVQKVISLIEATKHRKRPIEKLQKIFWDADNAKFKKGYHTLLNNEKLIRKEYAHLSPNAYQKKRVKFLESNIGLFNDVTDNNIKKLIKYIKKTYKS
jgi:predicted metal-dependent HD superfamily phosphohydrolase